MPWVNGQWVPPAGQQNYNMNSPIPTEWEDYVTQLPRGLEVVPSHLYDTETFTSAVTRDMSFFTTVKQNINLSNMKRPGELPSQEAMLITNIRVKYKTRPLSNNSGLGDSAALASTFDDVVRLADFGACQLIIGEKNYGPWLPWTLPANSFVKGQMATGSDVLANYGQIDGALYPLFPNLMLAPGQNFEFKMVWPATPALTLNSETVAIVVLFDGQRSRSIQ
jgi:hypothetical protein